ncbi:MAG: M3 family oligoendopeptidase [Nitrospiraceae bacterium]|nr:MAG: M3 family oligoendopeptidase [Nitrospiraceae bacterium]
MNKTHKKARAGKKGMHNDRWNLKTLFRSDNDPRMEEERKRVKKTSYEFIEKWRSRTDYLEDPAVLKEALDDYEDWKRSYGTDGNEGYYFYLRTQQDKNSPVLRARFNKIEEFSRKIENDIQFFCLRIAKINPGHHSKLLSYPPLKPYKHFIERIFDEAAYVLSEPEERILNFKRSTSYHDWMKLTSGLLAKEERYVLLENGKKGLCPFSKIVNLVNSRRKKVRDSSALALNQILEKHLDVAEAELNAVLANKKTDDELRGLSRPDLMRHISDDIESEIVDSLIQSVSDRFDISSRFYKLKARLLKVKRLRYHERNVDYGKIRKEYTYNDAIRIVHTVLNRLDSDFGSIINTYVQNGQLDVYPRKGKAGGAFCAHHLIGQPTYILLNHTDKLQDVLTLAHELGHGINNELMRKTQNALNFNTPLSTAEVASTFMEDFVLQDILEETDDELKCAVLVKKLDNDISTVFRQVACYKFEQELHHEFRKTGYLSKHEIGRLFRKHMSSYMGRAVEQSDGSENWWVYWSHIRMFFYVYSYASGLLISKSLQSSVKKDPKFIKKVKGFLSAGMSDSPQNIFKKLGINITRKEFWNHGLNEVENLLDQTTELAKKLNKI